MFSKAAMLLIRLFSYGGMLIGGMGMMLVVAGCSQGVPPQPTATVPPLSATATSAPAPTEAGQATLKPTADATEVVILATEPAPVATPDAEATEITIPTAEATEAPAVTAEVTVVAIATSEPTATFEVHPNSFALTVPLGVKVQLFRGELDHPIAMTFDDTGALYVGINNGIYPTGPVGEIYRLQDLDGDGWAEKLTLFADGLDRPVGLVFRDGQLYVSQRGSVLRMRDNDGDGQADETVTLVSDLPAYGLHHNNGLIFGPDGLLYLTLGSSTNNGPEENLLNGTILRFQPDGSGQEIFASGMRNPYDMAFDAAGHLFAPDNGCDPPECIDAPEELNHIVQGGQYGYPEYVGIPPQGSDTRAPILTFPTHTSPDGMLFYDGNMFPEWKGDLFMAFFGSYLPGFTEVGRRVGRIELTPTGDTFQAIEYPFIGGLNRPLDLAVAPDGAIFVADFGEGRIYRFYR